MTAASLASRIPGDPPLLSLPNELLLKVVGYFVPTLRLLKNQGFGSSLEEDQADSWETTLARHQHGTEKQNILNISLTCKRLTPIAQDILYRDVSLPQPYRTHLSSKPAPSFLAQFLRTIIRRPELGIRVHSLAVWLWTGKLVRSPVEPEKGASCACEGCMTELGDLVDKLQISTEEKKSWMGELKCPSEATVCGFLFAALLKLRTVELYVKPLHPNTLHSNTQADVVRLSQGLAASRISSLTLSTNLNGLGATRLPSLTTLTLDYDGSDPFATASKGCFTNVNTLKIQTRSPSLTRWHDLDGSNRHIFRRKLQILMKGLPNLRTLKMDSGPTLNCYPIPMGVDTVAIHRAGLDTLLLVREYLVDKVAFPKHLRRIELHWREDLPPPKHRMLGVQEIAKRAGVMIVIVSHGEVFGIYK